MQSRRLALIQANLSKTLLIKTRVFILEHAAVHVADRSLARFGFPGSSVNVSGVNFASVHALPLIALFLLRGQFNRSAHNIFNVRAEVHAFLRGFRDVCSDRDLVFELCVKLFGLGLGITAASGFLHPSFSHILHR